MTIRDKNKKIWIETTKYEWISDMKLWNTIKSLFSQPSTPVEVEEDVIEEIIIERIPVETTEDLSDCSLILERILTDAGVKRREFEKIKIFELFEEWYSGDCTEEAIRQSIPEFKAAHGAVSAKLIGKL